MLRQVGENRLLWGSSLSLLSVTVMMRTGDFSVLFLYQYIVFLHFQPWWTCGRYVFVRAVLTFWPFLILVYFSCSVEQVWLSEWRMDLLVRNKTHKMHLSVEAPYLTTLDWDHSQRSTSPITAEDATSSQNRQKTLQQSSLSHQRKLTRSLSSGKSLRTFYFYWIPSSYKSSLNLNPISNFKRFFPFCFLKTH